MNESSTVAALLEANGYVEDDAENQEQESHPNGRSPFQLLIGVIIRPRETFEVLRDREKRHWWLPFVVTLVGVLLLAVAENAVQQSMLANMPAEMQELMGGGTSGVLTILGQLAIGAVTVLLGYLLAAGVLFGGGLILGGKSTWKQAMGVAAWSSVPLAIRRFVQAIASFATGGYPVSGFSGAFTMVEVAERSTLYALLSKFDIYLVWSLLLFGIGAAVTTRLKKSKPLIIVLIYIVIGILLVLAMNAASGFVSGLVGGSGSGGPGMGMGMGMGGGRPR
ncbi:MAG: YIP1 family protein [Anaerolineae bacterium]|nr:YIP1 family protein [Anaerolineae bacterium]